MNSLPDAIAQCPVCKSYIRLSIRANVKPVIQKTLDGKRYEAAAFSFVEVKHVEAVEAKLNRTLMQIGGRIEPGMSIDELSDLLSNECGICKAHIPLIVDQIIGLYSLYVPDGKTLEKIK